MTLQIQLFATLKDCAPDGQLEIEAPDDARVADVWDAAIERAPQLAKWRRHARVAVNHEYASDDTKVHDSDEIAFIPPVSGGASEPLVEVRASELSLDEVVRAVQAEMDGKAGAICTFLGVVRSNSTDPDGQKHDDIEYLDYEAYAPMAGREMHAICLHIRETGRRVRHHPSNRTFKRRRSERGDCRRHAASRRLVRGVSLRHRNAEKASSNLEKETARDGFWWVEGSSS